MFSQGLSSQCPYPYSEHQSICLPRKPSNISRKVSGPALGTVGPAQTLIWFTPACTCFQSPQLPPKSTSSNTGEHLLFIQIFHRCRVYQANCRVYQSTAPAAAQENSLPLLRSHSPWSSALVWTHL